VAQLDSASVFGTEGCRFESCRAYWTYNERPGNLYPGTLMGDTDVKAYVIAALGGVAGGLLASNIAVVIGAYIPVFIYQLGLPDVSMGFDEYSQSGRGANKFSVAFFASMIPGLIGLFSGMTVAAVVHGVDLTPTGY
jgi:hypothetical protein